MIRLRLPFILTMAGMMVATIQVHAQTLRTRTDLPQLQPIAPASPWEASLHYGVSTDYADTRSPRGYSNSFMASLGYNIDENWSVSIAAGGHAETVDGQIDKGTDQTYTETLNPTTSAELDYSGRFWGANSYSLFLHGEPLWDQPSQLEGYRGLVGGGASLSFQFFQKAYTLSQTVDATELLNTFYFGTDLDPNPDMFYTYSITNAFRFWGSYKIAYSFGLKATRYLDGFIGYNYDNVFSLSKTWKQWTVALAYENGGYTEYGEVSLWYIDQYRRIGRAVVNYAF